MGDQAMNVTIERKQGMVIARPEGDIDLASSPSLRAQLREIVGEADDAIVVDLEAFPYMDSSGVATLVELLQSCRQKGLDLTLCRLGERVLSVFQIARLDGVFKIAGSIEECTGTAD
ncbi:MAG: hypothetical protein CMJ40_04190 [Phycisphaerae bacterium]|nr:hypothetical protein [Phycisphaerae bacterium]